MHPTHAALHHVRAVLPQLVRILAWFSIAACSSTVGYEGEEPAPEPSPTPLPMPAPAPTGGAGGASVTAPPAASAGSASNPSETPGILPITPPDPGNPTPPTTDTASFQDACLAAGAGDQCAECLCGQCSRELQDCQGIAGCPEILACVQQSGCSGTDCYCGDERLTACLAGGGNGPCKEAVLAAPGGRAPTLSNPSGGPATDAALEVAECGDDDDRCADVCDIGD